MQRNKYKEIQDNGVEILLIILQINLDIILI